MKLVGSLVDRVRTGQDLPTRHHNPYLLKATELEGYLLTPSEIAERGAGDLFAGPVAQGPEAVGATRRPLVIEVGSYMGKNLLEMASTFPDRDFLGLDITYKRTVKTAQKIRGMGLTNAKIAICDARPLFKEIRGGSVSGVCVFFPDPWPKLKQAKNRLLQSDFFAQVARVLEPGGFLWIKTDSKSYFEQVLEESREWLSIEGTYPLAPGVTAIPNAFAGHDFVTVFEELFRRKGQPMHSIVLTRQHEPLL